MYRLEDVLEANLPFSIGQTAVVLRGQKLDKKKIIVRICLEESVEV
jgi:hypothetical protein